MAYEYSYTFGYRLNHLPTHERLALDKLDGDLREILNAIPTANAPSRGRDRYIKSLLVLSDFLKDQGINHAVVRSLQEIAFALEDLDKGVVREFLYVDRDKIKHTSHPGDVWSARACLAVAQDFLVGRGLKARPASRKVAALVEKSEAMVLFTSELCGEETSSRQTSRRKFNPAESVRKWWERLENGEFPSARALDDYNHRDEWIKEIYQDVIQAGSKPSDDNIADCIVRYASALGLVAADKDKLGKVGDTSRLIRSLLRPIGE